jgi:energy-coupling factor transport system ATP-binding protein
MLKIKALSLAYDSLCILNNFNLELNPGTICVLTGCNGCGKSSLLSSISGVIPEYIPATVTGSIKLDEISLQELALKEKFHYLWHAQSDSDSQFFFPTCEAELAFALENYALPTSEIRSRIDIAAHYFGLDISMAYPPQSLSGGEKKLLLCAIGMAMDTPLYLLDEPASSLSGTSLKLLCNWLQELKTRGKIVLIAEHIPEIIAIADVVIALDAPKQ